MCALAIHCRGLTRILPSGDREITVLEDVDLDVPVGQMIAVTGPSGSGKSTLLGLLAGLDRADEGTLEIEGVDMMALQEEDRTRLRRERIGFIFQSFHLLGNLTARENILFPLQLNGIGGAAERTEDLLARVGLEGRGHHYPSELSGGEQQRVAIARAFGARPSLLFADEPTGNLDRKSGARVLSLLDSLRTEQETTVVLVTHDEDLAARAERRIRLLDGRIVEDALAAGASA